MYLYWVNFNYMDTVYGLWIEMKTLSSYMLSFLANKDGYATDVLHSIESFCCCWKRLYRRPSNDEKMSTKVIPAGGVTRFLRAVRYNLHPNVPQEQSLYQWRLSQNCWCYGKWLLLVLRKMAAGNVGIHASHARSGHAIDSNQKHYQTIMMCPRP